MFDRATAEEMLESVFAPWVQALDLSIESLDQQGAILRMRFSESGLLAGLQLPKPGRHRASRGHVYSSGNRTR